MEGVHIFRTGASAPGLYDSLFGGIYFAVGAPMMAQVFFLVALPGAILCSMAYGATRNPLYRWFTWVLGLFTFSLLCFFHTHPWDELFVNLRHSLHLMQDGFFSFNRNAPIEGTVDFLPYFLIGLLGKLGLPLPELAFLQSGLGGVLCILASCRILSACAVRGAWTGAFVFFCIFPPLVLNSANGFTAPTFSACILWSVYFLFFSNRQIWGLILISFLPLIRFEGFLLMILLTAFATKKVRDTALVSIPFLIFCCWKYHFFGNVLAVPIRYKATTSGIFFALVGLRNFFADLVNGWGLAALSLIFLTKLYAGKTGIHDPQERHFVWLLLIVILYCATYYVSGGDWLPRYWGRYLLPFSLLSVTAAAFFADRSFTKLSSSNVIRIVSVSALILLLQAPWYFSTYRKMWDEVFTHKKIMANIFGSTGPTHHRIHHLSQLGWHLKQTTRPQDVIASSEIATIMFYAERETLDLLGVANPELLKQAPRKPPPIVHPFPPATELPYLIFRRLDPEIVARHRPQVVYTFDFFMTDIMPELPFEEITKAEIHKALNRWRIKFRGLNGPLYGGVENLLKLDYLPVVIIYENRFCSLYFVSKEFSQVHFSLLKEHGFSETS